MRMGIVVLVCGLCIPPSIAVEPLVPDKHDGTLRIATFNVSLHRAEAGKLRADLEHQDPQILAIAAVIRAVCPDVLLLNEVDFATDGSNVELFEKLYLSFAGSDLLGNEAWPMPHTFSAPVNTGVPSGLDLNANGSTADSEDAWGYGLFSGQYGMGILSRYEIDRGAVRTLQALRWATLPGALRPRDPESQAEYYDDTIWEKLRLSSKSFWDVTIHSPEGDVHVLASHPTPPAFDGPEDRNGCRNHDEIKLIEHYINDAEFIVDDQGKSAGLESRASFVVLGDLNSDPRDGGSRARAIVDLLNHPRIAHSPPPRSPGAAIAARTQAGANRTHTGDPAEDTGDFNDRAVGNLRVDYALPSSDLRVVSSGVFWPDLETIDAKLRAGVRAVLKATDHHLVWIDVTRGN